MGIYYGGFLKYGKAFFDVTPKTKNVLSTGLRQTVDQCTKVHDIIQCAPSVRLDAAPQYVNSDYEILWSTGETGDHIIVNNKGQYWVEYRYKPGNQAKNGSFESGNTQFSSAYTYKADNGLYPTDGNNSELWAEKTYTVVKDPRLVHANFPSSIKDHTTGNGNMMVINGSTDQNVKIWYQTITVKPNTCYLFSIYATSVTETAPANLIFSIGGNQFGTIQLSTTVNRWDEFTRMWYSGSSTSVEIAIVNKTTESSGNDFALDDITFMPYEREVFNVDLNPPKPAINPNYP